MSKSWIIKTEAGYVGRTSLTGPIREDLAASQAYTFDTAADARAVADTLECDAVVEVLAS